MSLILIADDNPHAHRMGRQILSQEGHEVATVSNGDEALEYLAENRPDLAMLDTRMPGPTGYDVCRHIKGSAELNQVKVVLLAGPLEPFDSSQADTAGSDAVLHKPLDAYSLLETVHSLIGKPLTHSEHGDRLANLQAAQTAVEELASDQEVEPATESAPEAAVEAAPQSSPATVEVSDDPFSDLVESALNLEGEASQREARVRQAVTEVLQASLPTLVETITQRVLMRLGKS